MYSSISFRQDLLDNLYNVLKDPLKYGDKFLLQITRTPQDGLVPVSLLHDMARVLNHVPLEYIKYCIPLDIYHRFRWNVDVSRVGLKENEHYYETDPYGFAIDDDNDVQDIREHDRVLPVIYDDGKFYIDNDHSRFRNTSQHTSSLEYDVLNITPLGQTDNDNHNSISLSTGNTCFNCDESNHSVKDCPYPYNKQRIARRRQELLVTTKRLHEVLELEQIKTSFKPGIISDTLREALGIQKDEDPPYYTQMRWYGYPPGYLVTNYTEQKAPCQLKIYYDSHYEVVVDSKEEEKIEEAHTELVHYPGLKFINTSRLDEYIQPATADQSSLLADQQYWWNSYYYQQDYTNNPLESAQTAYESYMKHQLQQQEQLYPPGTDFQYETITSESSYNKAIIETQTIDQNKPKLSNNADDETVEMNISDDDMDISSDDDM
ncbi:uncharacterized protein BX663DRAFT_523383 [Cokeromyces recurvatus]|uniref:uncharacterized protein n=1 Tax=Cokeromyces recurvatus TaxID=90255 RepID=UPI00221E6D1F|nr:uncharacterized protein BX663DRAFT_523383 [Cokeromyces recurvatus]KAI7898768.1 hypothetical protein BX663DRAFT_523383 [Cokeromyces recurvatus]